MGVASHCLRIHVSLTPTVLVEPVRGGRERGRGVRGVRG